jgi:hypothetical protein
MLLAPPPPGPPLLVPSHICARSFLLLSRSVDFITDRAEEDLAAGVPNLVAAARIVFSGNPFSMGPGAVLRMVPAFLEPLAFHLLFSMVGRVARRLEYARATLMSTADVLMGAAAARAEASGEALPLQRTDWRWWGPEVADRNPYKARRPPPRPWEHCRGCAVCLWAPRPALPCPALPCPALRHLAP